MAVIEKMESLLRAARFSTKIYLQYMLQYMLNFDGVYCIIKCTYTSDFGKHIKIYVLNLMRLLIRSFINEASK